MPWTLCVSLLESTELNNIKCLEHKKSSVTRSHWRSDFFCTHWYNWDIAHASPSFSHLDFSSESFGVFTSCFLQVTYPAPVWLPLPTGTHRSPGTPELPNPVFISADLLVAPDLVSLSPSWTSLLPGLQDTACSCFNPDLWAFFSLHCIGGCSVSAHCLKIGESSLSVFLLTMWPRMSSLGFLHKWSGDGCIPPLRIRLASPWNVMTTAPAAKSAVNKY